MRKHRISDTYVSEGLLYLLQAEVVSSISIQYMVSCRKQ